METNSNISNEFDFYRIKQSLNTSMEEDDISVSEELINRTMEKIEQDDTSSYGKTSNKNKRKNRLYFTNVAAAVLIVFLVGIGLVKGISGDYFSLSKSDQAPEIAEDNKEMNEDIAYEEENDLDGEVEFSDSIEDTNEIGKTASELVIPNVIDLDLSNIDILEVSYYDDNDDVINRDLTRNLEEVFVLFSTYPLEEISPREDETWKYRLNVLPITNDTRYTITIGENINIIEERWPLDESELSEPDQYERRTFQVEEVEKLKVQIEQIINSSN